MIACELLHDKRHPVDHAGGASRACGDSRHLPTLQEVFMTETVKAAVVDELAKPLALVDGIVAPGR